MITWFERISMLVILLNCITLGMYQPCVDFECATNRCKILQVSSYIFTQPVNPATTSASTQSKGVLHHYYNLVCCFARLAENEQNLYYLCFILNIQMYRTTAFVYLCTKLDWYGDLHILTTRLINVSIGRPLIPLQHGRLYCCTCYKQEH